MKNIFTMFRSTSFFSLLAALLITPLFAFASVNVSNVSGNWISTQGGSNLEGVGTSQVRWGGSYQTFSEKSGYNFSPNPTLFSVDPGVPFVLGTFTHVNQVIPIGSAITQATLDVNFDIAANHFDFQYIFNHNETPNIPGQCPPGSVSVCDDIVTAVKNPVSSQQINIDGQIYTLTIEGFQVNGNTFTNFLTQENMNSSAFLIGQLTLVAVPEPSTYLLMGSVLGLALFFAKKKKAVPVKK